MPGDVSDPDYCEALVKAAAKTLNGLDIVVNSAGIIHHATVEETTDAQWEATLAVNVSSIFYVCRCAVPLMKKQGGVIINIASDAALSGSKHLVAYCASKGAVLQMSRAMAIDHAADRIRVIPVCPGDVDTAMLRGEFRDRGLSPEEGLRDSGRFITGYPLLIDGGGRA